MTNKGLSILLLYRRSRQGDVHRGNRHWCRIDDLLATASAVRQFHMILLIESSDIMSTSSSWVDARYGWFMCAAAVAFRCCSCLFWQSTPSAGCWRTFSASGCWEDEHCPVSVSVCRSLGLGVCGSLSLSLWVCVCVGVCVFLVG